MRDLIFNSLSASHTPRYDIHGARIPDEPESTLTRSEQNAVDLFVTVAKAFDSAIDPASWHEAGEAVRQALYPALRNRLAALLDGPDPDATRNA